MRFVYDLFGGEIVGFLNFWAAVSIAVYLAIVGGIGFVVFHFIAKFW